MSRTVAGMHHRVCQALTRDGVGLFVRAERGDSGVANDVVSVGAGRVRGRWVDDVLAFKGIPYGADTGNDERFAPPRPPQPWPDVRGAFEYGCDAPQRNPDAPGQAAIGNADTTLRDESEDCLVLNVWTPGPGTPDAGTADLRPVMFWLHGGGFVTGSGSAAMYDGSNLVRRGDVVVVSINHRLGALGFLNLAPFGGPVNGGMLDILLALEWVRDNIAAFGGDPDDVTVFGESGGGRKIACLLAMPCVEGLFHKAIIQSGPGVFMNEPDAAADVTRLMLEELGITDNVLTQLRDTPIDALLRAQAAVLQRLRPVPEGLTQVFAAVVDGEILPGHPFEPKAPSGSSDIPLMIGFNRTEGTLWLARDPALTELDEQGLRQRAASMFGADAGRILDVFRAAYPDAECPELLALLDTGQRRYALDTIRLAERKAARRAAHVYLYALTWETTARRGTLRTPHALEIPLVFDNVAAAERFVGTNEPQVMADRLSDTWLAFARTGDPNNPSIPTWPAYDAEQRRSMIFDLTCRVVEDYGREHLDAFDPVFYPMD